MPEYLRHKITTGPELRYVLSSCTRTEMREANELGFLWPGGARAVAMMRRDGN